MPPIDLFMDKVSKGPIAGLAPIPITTCKVRIDRLSKSQHFIDQSQFPFERVVEVASFKKSNYTVSASIVDPSASLTAVTRPSEPASKLFIEAPCSTEKRNKVYSLCFYNSSVYRKTNAFSVRHWSWVVLP